MQSTSVGLMAATPISVALGKRAVDITTGATAVLLAIEGSMHAEDSTEEGGFISRTQTGALLRFAIVSLQTLTDELDRAEVYVDRGVH